MDHRKEVPSLVEVGNLDHDDPLVAGDELVVADTFVGVVAVAVVVVVHSSSEEQLLAVSGKKRMTNKLR